MPEAPWSALAAAVAFGLYAGFAPGPTLALVIGQTLRFGRREGFKVACAPLVTDAPIVALSLLVLTRLDDHAAALRALAIVGAGVLVLIAIDCFRARAPEAQSADTAVPRSWLKGALANGLNPHPYVAWVTVVGPELLRAADSGLAWGALFLVLFYAPMVGSKMAVAAAVERGRDALHSRAYRAVMVALGLLLLGFAARLAYEAWAG